MRNVGWAELPESKGDWDSEKRLSAHVEAVMANQTGTELKRWREIGMDRPPTGDISAPSSQSTSTVMGEIASASLARLEYEVLDAMVTRELPRSTSEGSSQ